MIVADASAILELLLRTSAGRAVKARLFRDGETIQRPRRKLATRARDSSRRQDPIP